LGSGRTLKKIRNMNNLITGVQDFVRGNLVAALKNQHIIYGLDVVSPTREGVNKTFGWNK
jgi:nucleoside-diphosphate-sugar epimerase